MRRIFSSIFLALLGLCLIYAETARASLYLQTAYLKDCKCGDAWTLRLDGGYTFGEFIGLKQDYAELGVFIAPKHTNRAQNFFDARGYWLDNGEGAASVGIGRRLWDCDSCCILGANLYYDFRHGRLGTFNRIGVGLECLCECVDFRVNGYFPLKHGTRHGKFNFFDDFIGPFFETCQEKEFAYLGFDGEIGRYLWCDCFCNLSCDLYGAIGPYFFQHSEREGVYGGYARLNLSLSEYLILEARVSSDNTFHTRFQGSVIFSFPLYQLFLCDPCENPCRELLTQPTIRNGLIFTVPCCSRTSNF